jgi:hypothetical protein
MKWDPMRWFNWRYDQARALEEEFPVGQKISYLGVDLVVVRHLYCNGLDVVPAVVTHFRDNDGVIRQLVFASHEIEALRRAGVRLKESEWLHNSK